MTPKEFKPIDLIRCVLCDYIEITYITDNTIAASCGHEQDVATNCNEYKETEGEK